MFSMGNAVSIKVITLYGDSEIHLCVSTLIKFHNNNIEQRMTFVKFLYNMTEQNRNFVNFRTHKQ